MKTYFMGVDPGATGAIAVIDEDNNLIVAEHLAEDIPAIANQFEAVLASCSGEVVFAVIEKVSAMPKQGVVSMFNFGMNFGSLQMALSCFLIPYELVTPQKWMKVAFDSGSGGKRIKTDKEASLNLARRLYPKAILKFKKNHGIADAIHMARYAKKNYEE